MDSIDYAILDELKDNGKVSASGISKKVNLSIPAVAERIRKLENGNVIEKYTVKINRKQVDKCLLAFIFVNVDGTDNIENFRKIIIEQNCVLECHHVAGNYDYLLKVAVKDTQDLEIFLSDTLKKIKGVSNSNTIITLMTLKEEINV